MRVGLCVLWHICVAHTARASPPHVMHARTVCGYCGVSAALTGRFCGLQRSQRAQRKIHGVRLIDHDAAHLVFDVEVAKIVGRLRASIVVARQLLVDGRLRQWSYEELAFLFFMCSGIPECYRLKLGTTWA